jgi:hypothetical protein
MATRMARRLAWTVAAAFVTSVVRAFAAQPPPTASVVSAKTTNVLWYVLVHRQGEGRIHIGRLARKVGEVETWSGNGRSAAGEWSLRSRGPVGAPTGRWAVCSRYVRSVFRWPVGGKSAIPCCQSDTVVPTAWNCSVLLRIMQPKHASSTSSLAPWLSCPILCPIRAQLKP